jgi:hypothetical protein
MKRRELFKWFFGTIIALAVKPLMGLVPAKSTLDNPYLPVDYLDGLKETPRSNYMGQWLVEVERAGVWHECQGYDFLSTDMQKVHGTVYRCALCNRGKVVEFGDGIMKGLNDCRVCGAKSRMTMYQDVALLETGMKKLRTHWDQIRQENAEILKGLSRG